VVMPMTLWLARGANWIDKRQLLLLGVARLALVAVLLHLSGGVVPRLEPPASLSRT
jgi:hypothetical protein